MSTNPNDPYFYLARPLKKLFLKAIRVYQATLSPDTGWLKGKYPAGYCKFEPHCSEYTYQAVEKYGLIKGGFKGLYRILRCHPWSKGGSDPLL
jgi:putative membrane protein insertion efficiency factor